MADDADAGDEDKKEKEKKQQQELKEFELAAAGGAIVYYEDLEFDSEEEQHHDAKDKVERMEEEDYVAVKDDWEPKNLSSVLKYREEIPAGIERRYANRLDEAFTPCRSLLLSLFRFPLQLTVHRDFTREYQYSWGRGWMFVVTGIIILLNLLAILVGIASVMLDTPNASETYDTIWNIEGKEEILNKTRQQLRLEELFLIQRNFVPVLILFLTLLHVSTGDIALFFRRAFTVRYFTFWDEAVEVMRIDAGTYPENVKKYLIRVIVFYIGFLGTISLLCGFRIAPICTGAPAQLVILWARPFIPTIHAWQHLLYLQIVGAVIYIYLIMCSKAYVLLLLYKAKILKNGFATWNERLEKVLHKAKLEKDKKSRMEQCRTRTGYDHLFRDYVLLLDLLRGGDTMFSNVIESYYGTQVFSFCFEVYYFVRSFSAPEEFKGARIFDGVIMGVYLFHSVIFLLISTHAAAEVGEVAMDGLEIIRRNGCMGRKTHQEMYFTLSLYMSYTGHFETALTGGRYVTYDRAFIVALVAAIFAYFIILSQFTPPLLLLDENRLQRINSSKLILHVEHTFQMGSSYQINV